MVVKNPVELENFLGRSEHFELKFIVCGTKGQKFYNKSNY